MVRIAKEYLCGMEDIIGRTKDIGLNRDKVLMEREKKSQFKGVEIHVKNLAPEVTEEMLNKIFLLYGKVVNIEIKPVGESKSRRYAIISYTSPASAASAIKYLNGSILAEQQIFVTQDPVKTRERKISSSSRMRKVSLGTSWSVPDASVFRGYGQASSKNNSSPTQSEGSVKDSDFLFMVKETAKRKNSVC